MEQRRNKGNFRECKNRILIKIKLLSLHRKNVGFSAIKLIEQIKI